MCVQVSDSGSLTSSSHHSRNPSTDRQNGPSLANQEEEEDDESTARERMEGGDASLGDEEMEEEDGTVHSYEERPTAEDRRDRDSLRIDDSLQGFDCLVIIFHDDYFLLL